MLKKLLIPKRKDRGKKNVQSGVETCIKKAEAEGCLGYTLSTRPARVTLLGSISVNKFKKFLYIYI